MNPDTGKFTELAEGQSAPAGWPVFHVGQQVTVQGYAFVVSRINRSSLVLKSAIALERESAQMAQLAALPPVRNSRRKKRRRHPHH